MPFLGILFSLALLPSLTPHFWHHHYGKLSLGITGAFLLPAGIKFGLLPLFYEVTHTVIIHYLPFVLISGALYTISNSIRFEIKGHCSPLINTAVLGGATLLSSWIGTTGASMVFIKPFLDLNRSRQHKAHLVIFFIFLVANIGGVLTPIGDPPLFLGFLNGVDFFWPTQNLWKPFFLALAILLATFFCFDSWMDKREGKLHSHFFSTTSLSLWPEIKVSGAFHLLLLITAVGAVLLSGLWKSNVSLQLLGTQLALENLARDSLLVTCACISYKLRQNAPQASGFPRLSWAPLKEVAKIFLAIFITVTPIIKMLEAGSEGLFGQLLALAGTGEHANPTWYFWLSGLLSAFLDNAPTYLVFFSMAGGDALQLMNSKHAVLAAISLGSVFMGALSYIGNAPNFMVKSIAEEHQIEMPSFFAYTAIASAVLLPLFAVVWYLFLRI